ncbi:MAG: redoxin domain-containing protein [Bacteroidales bacterium]|jgi:thiol-disulfide isomerase/thioredoxin|nr:redoxin domain-containing protein [Bacteroidales bacterium]
MNILRALINIFGLSALVVLPVAAQGHEIKIAVKADNDTVMLGHYFAKQDMLIPDDTIVLNKSGYGVFKGNRKLDKGMYFIVSDRRKLFDFIVGDEQNFEITATDTADLVNGIRFKNSAENDVLVAFQRTNVRMSIEADRLRKEIEAASQEKKDAIRQQLFDLSKERLEYIQKLADTHEGLFVSKFLKALIPMTTKLPDYPRDTMGNITDSTYVYRWYRAHFFDNFDIFDQDMIRTMLYEDKVIEYFRSVLPQIPDTLCAEAGKIFQKVKDDNVLFRYMLITLFNHYAKSDIIAFENVWVNLAEKWYIPYATWTSADYLKTLKKEVEERLPNLIGKIAPPIEMMMALPPDHFKAAALDTAIKFDLHAGTPLKDFRQSVKTKYTVLLFWDITCSHCRETIQALHEVYENELKGKNVTVITVQMLNTKDAKGKWVDFVNEHQLLDWTNAWSPYDAVFKKTYNAATVPLIYVLNEKKEIVGKRLTPDQLHLFIR